MEERLASLESKIDEVLGEVKDMQLKFDEILSYVEEKKALLEKSKKALDVSLSIHGSVATMFSVMKEKMSGIQLEELSSSSAQEE